MVIVTAIGTMVLIAAALGVAGLGLGLAQQEQDRVHDSNAEVAQTSPSTLRLFLNGTSLSSPSLPNGHSSRAKLSADERYGPLVRPRLPVFGIQKIQSYG